MSPLSRMQTARGSVFTHRSRLISAIAGVAVVVALAGPAAMRPPATLAESLEIGASVVVDTDRLNLRAEPSTAAEVIATFEDGTWGEVLDGPVTAEGYEWYQYDVDGKTGWSVADFLSSGDGERGLLATGDQVFVNSDSVNMRAEAGLEGEVVAKLVLGTKAEVISGPSETDGYYWYEVQAGDASGHVVRDFLAFVEPRADRDESSDGESGQVAGATGVVVEDLRLREKAGTDGTVIKVLPKGTVVTVVSGPVEANLYLWYEVEADGSTGWVAGEFIDFSAEAEAADDSDSDSEPTETAVPEETATSDDSGAAAPTETPASSTPLAKGDAVKVTVDQLNMRATPSATGTVVSKLNRGATLMVVSGPVTADGMTWYEVESVATKGWVVAEYIARIQP